MLDLELACGKRIPGHCLSVRFARSGGPGGQNVNKVSSKADVRLDIGALEGIFSLEELAAIRQALANRLDAEGRLQVQADEYRDQGRNLEAARARMVALLDGALYRPKKRRPSRPSAGARERRLSEKKRRSRIKNLRHPRPGRE